MRIALVVRLIFIAIDGSFDFENTLEILERHSDETDSIMKNRFNRINGTVCRWTNRNLHINCMKLNLFRFRDNWSRWSIIILVARTSVRIARSLFNDASLTNDKRLWEVKGDDTNPYRRNKDKCPLFLANNSRREQNRTQLSVDPSTVWLHSIGKPIIWILAYGLK